MDIPPKLMQYRFHFTVALIFSVVAALLAYAAPRILNILAYFWPLFASTAAFLAIVVVFGGVHQLSGDGHGEKAGEGLMDYVAARPPYPDDSHKDE